MRLIDADALKKRLVKCAREGVNLNSGVARIIETAPTIVEFEGDINKVIVKGEEYHRIVRCKDCKFYKKTSDGISYCYDHDDDILWQDDDYCSRAERRSDDGL